MQKGGLASPRDAAGSFSKKQKANRYTEKTEVFMRKLASIQRIKQLEPIPEADAIVKATVLGWQVVVKGGEFKEGDLCVYVEIDSILPDKPEFDFLRNKKFRIRTVKLRGQISQGICFPLSILPPEMIAEEDADVTEVLNIIKYEAPVPPALAGIMKGNFPAFVPKTDEDRVQIMEKELHKQQGRLCYITEKLDGTSITFYVKDEAFGVCSRNMDLVEGDNLYWRAAKALDIENKMKKVAKNFALQGELMGEGIQGNKLKLKGQSVYFFNLFWIDEYRYATYKELRQTLHEMDLIMVPVIEEGWMLHTEIQHMLKQAQIPSLINPAVMAEGLVVRAMNDVHFSFKAINNEFLLKWGE